jgi:hypothetical protein
LQCQISASSVFQSAAIFSEVQRNCGRFREKQREIAAIKLRYCNRGRLLAQAGRALFSCHGFARGRIGVSPMPRDMEIWKLQHRSGVEWTASNHSESGGERIMSFRASSTTHAIIQSAYLPGPSLPFR